MAKPSKRILIVDDEPSVVEVLSEAFKAFKHGYAYEVETAANGFDAFQAMVRAKPDLILLDMQMPGMTGLQLLKQIRLLDKRVPVIMVTANRDTKAAADTLQQGVFAYVPKPFDLRHLDHLVALVLQQETPKAAGPQGSAPR